MAQENFKCSIIVSNSDVFAILIVQQGSMSHRIKLIPLGGTWLRSGGQVEYNAVALFVAQSREGYYM